MNEKERPNVILICVDQWRGDCLGVDGHPVVRTPYLDQMARQGCRFTSAYSATPTCIPARAALFTGLSQESHGRVGYQDGVPWTYPTTLAGEFTRQGYQTQSIGKMHVYPERARLGFQNVILHDGYLHHARKHRNHDDTDDYLPWLRRELGRDADYFDHGVNCNSFVTRPWDKPEHTHPTDFVTSQGIDFLRRRDPTAPFFLFLSYHRPHPPFDPPQWALDLYRDAPMPPPPRGDWNEVFARHADPHSPEPSVADWPEARVRAARAGYYALMTQIDHQINRFREVLRERGLAENTWICFTSDHGEMIGDHGLYRKSVPYEGSARVPLLLLGPGLGQRRTSDGLAELRDILPTLLDCAGLEIPDSVEGKSLLPLARGEAASVREDLHGEHTHLGQGLHWLTDGREKYIWFSADGHEQLFDLKTDPGELHDLARDTGASDRVARWRARMAEVLAGREEGFSDGKRLVPGRPVTAVLRNVLA